MSPGRSSFVKKRSRFAFSRIFFFSLTFFSFFFVVLWNGDTNAYIYVAKGIKCVHERRYSDADAASYTRCPQTRPQFITRREEFLGFFSPQPHVFELFVIRWYRIRRLHSKHPGGIYSASSMLRLAANGYCDLYFESGASRKMMQKNFSLENFAIFIPCKNWTQIFGSPIYIMYNMHETR